MDKSIPNYKVEILIFIGLLVIPFIVVPSDWTYDPAAFPKTLGLQVLLLVGLPIIWLQSRRWMGEALSHELPVLYLISLLFGLFSLAWATNPIVGFYDFIRYLTVALFYFLVLFSLRHLPQDFLLKTLVVSGLILAAIGLLQCLGWKVLTAIPGGTRPPYATMVNKNLYASVMLILFCFTSVSVVLLQRDWRYLSVVSAIAIFAALLLTGTRGAWVGLGLGLAVTGAIAVALVMKQQLSIVVNPRKVAYIAILGVVVLAAVVYGANVYLSEAQTPVGRRIQSIFVLDDIRFSFWQDTLKMIKDTPVAGVGLGNFKIEFRRYYPAGTKVVARPHNDLLWILSETGIIGLMLYLLLIGFHLKYLIQTLFSNESGEQDASQRRRHVIFLLGVCFATTAYLTNSLFTFPRERIYVSMLFAMCLALSTHAVIQTQKTPRYLRPLTHLFTNRGVPTITYAILMVVLVVTMQRTYADKGVDYVNTHYWRAHNKEIPVELVQPYWTAIRNASTYAINHWSIMDFPGAPIHWYRGLSHLNLGDISSAKADFEAAYRYHPNHMYVLRNLAQVYEQEGLLDEATAAYRRIDALHTRIRWRESYDPEMLNAEGIGFPFLRPIESGTISIKPKGGENLGWTAKWTEKTVQLTLGTGKKLDYGATYIITLKTRDKVGSPIHRTITLTTTKKQ